MSRASMVRLLLVVAAGVALVSAYRLGVVDLLRHPERARQVVLDLGPWGWVAYLAAYAFLQPVGVPGTGFVVAAGLIWPLGVAVPLAFAGTVLATVVGFSFSRFVARDWVAARIPARLHRYDQRLQSSGFVTVLLLRSVLWMNPWLHALFGVSSVPFSVHLAASCIAYVPSVILITVAGDAAVGWLRHQPASTWAVVLAALAILAVAMWVIRRRATEG